MDFWSNALPLMKKKGKKQKDLVRVTGKSSASVCDWVNKKVMPRADDALKIADLLGVSVRYLVTGKDEDMPVRIREIVELCRGLDDKELETVCNMLRGLQKRDCPESGTEAV